MRYWTYPAEAENGATILVTGRDDVDKYRSSGKYNFRVEVHWRYAPEGMPTDDQARLMGDATDALQAALDKNKGAVLTGIYTGDGSRDWIFYTKGLEMFGKIFNRALEGLPQMPLQMEAYQDPDWEEYGEMRLATYVPPSPEE